MLNCGVLRAPYPYSVLSVNNKKWRVILCVYAKIHKSMKRNARVSGSDYELSGQPSYFKTRHTTMTHHCTICGQYYEHDSQIIAFRYETIECYNPVSIIKLDKACL